jgi:uncharacterized protein (TIGR02001 family)
VIARAACSKKSESAAGKRLLHRAAFALILNFAAAAPALAQVTGSVGLDSDYRLRGYSLSNDRPAASAQVSYDDPSGLYLSVLGLAELGRDTRFLGVVANAGYAKRLKHHLTIDGGVLRSQIRAASAERLSFEYTEIYAGASAGPITGRIYYSPDYRSGSQSTLYGEIEGGFEPLRNWRLAAHVGLLTYLNSASFYEAGDTHKDWRVSLVRQLGKFEVHAAVSGGVPYAYSGYRVHKKFAFTVGSSFSF